jgi:hypothetical protein
MKAAEYLQSSSSVPLTISWHENKRSYLSFRKERTGVFIRLHRLFEDVPVPVLDALARYILKRDLSAKPLLRRAVHHYFSNRRIASDALLSQGRCYDLKEIYDQIKHDFFTPAYDAAIGWGRGSVGSRFRHITFGTYDRHRHQILIHPLLDDPEVPAYFISFIVYHEMLHAVCQSQIDMRGYMRCHTREFRQREKLFPQYKQAKEWEKNSLIWFKRRSRGRT